eukprot:COSAG01_NODE_18066_length_1103_cov_0.671315_2_plen_82_part_00
MSDNQSNNKIFEVMSEITSNLEFALQSIDNLSEKIMKLREKSLEVLVDIVDTTNYSELSPDGQELYDEFEVMIENKKNRLL